MTKVKFKIVVLCGGFESERHASILTGKNIHEALIQAGYKNVSLIKVNKNIARLLIKLKPDFVFLAMFCKWGEDGVIQGLLETLGIPYSGCGVEASAISNNKFLFSMVAKACGIKVPKTFLLNNKDELQSFKIPIPCIVRPVYQGHSIGLSLIKNKNNLKAGVQNAFKFSSRIIIQEYIKGKELTVGVLDIPRKGTVVLPISELRMTKEIQNSDLKDSEGEFIKTIVPANLSRSKTNELEKLSLKLYKALGCEGVSRFDLRQDKNGEYYFLENNSCPGIINFQHSDLPKQLKAAGISMGQFVEYMIQKGMTRKPNKIDFRL